MGEETADPGMSWESGTRARESGTSVMGCPSMDMDMDTDTDTAEVARQVDHCLALPWLGFAGRGRALNDVK